MSVNEITTYKTYYQLVEYLSPKMQEIVKNINNGSFERSFYRILDKIFSYENNREILSSKIINQFLFNIDLQEELISLYGLDEEWDKVLAESDMLKAIGAGTVLEKKKKVTKTSHSGKEIEEKSTYNIYRFVIPTLMLSFELYKNTKKNKLAVDLFICAYLRLFSSTFQKYFRLS